MRKLFISYRRNDNPGLAGRIYDRLAAHFGRDVVVMDIDSIPYGTDFRNYLISAVANSDVLLAVIADRWLTAEMDGRRRIDDPADFVRIEIESALAGGIPVIPVLIGNTPMPREQDLPGALASFPYRNAATVDPGRDFHPHVDRLIRQIEQWSRPAAGPPGGRVGGMIQAVAHRDPAAGPPSGVQVKAFAADLLGRLPTRAILAFAVRCARRVQPLVGLLESPSRDALVQAIASADALARGAGSSDAVPVRDAAKAVSTTGRPRAVGFAVQTAQNVAVAACYPTRSRDAASFAAFAGVAAAEAVRLVETRGAIRMKRPTTHMLHESVEKTPENLAIAEFMSRSASIIMPSEIDDAAARDLERLAAMNLGRADEPGTTIDPGESGPLGPLWPGGHPVWYMAPPSIDELSRTHAIYEG